MNRNAASGIVNAPMGSDQTDRGAAKARLAAAGYLPWPIDLTGATVVAPDGHRLLTVEAALAELEAALTEGRAAT